MHWHHLLFAIFFAIVSIAPASAREAGRHGSAADAAIAGAEICSSVYLNVLSSAAPRSLSELYDQTHWRQVDALPDLDLQYVLGADFGHLLGEAELAPGVAGRVVSSLGRNAISGGTRCNVLVFAAPGSREALIESLQSSEIWVPLEIGDIPGTWMFGRATPSPTADIGLTVYWDLSGGENSRQPNARLSISLIPKSSIAEGVFPPSAR